MNRQRIRSPRQSLHLRACAFLATFGVLLAIGGCQWFEPTPTTPDGTGVSPQPSTFEPRPVIDVARIQPFRLRAPFKFDWRRDRPEVQSGLLVVFKVDPDLVAPSNALEPVLYAGNHTVQRLNQGHESGFVIGIIPEQIDLSKAPIWFGTPALPERIDTDVIARERARAERSGVSALDSTAIQSRTRNPVVAPDLTTLLREQAADLLLEFSPQEKPLADAWRLPATRP